MKSEERVVRVERRGDRYVEVFPNGRTRPLQTGKTDWSRLEAMTDEEIDAAAGADPDAQPLTDAQHRSAHSKPNRNGSPTVITALNAATVAG